MILIIVLFQYVMVTPSLWSGCDCTVFTFIFLYLYNISYTLYLNTEPIHENSCKLDWPDRPECCFR